MRRTVVWAIMATAIVAVACTRAGRGDGCRNDSDCAQDLRCMQTAANTAICTTPCNGADQSCPKGWKCIELDHFTESKGCVRE